MEIPFVGPSYVSRSVNVDAQRSINVYPELVESEDGKNTYCLIGTPGLQQFIYIGNGPIRGQYLTQLSGDRLFVVVGNSLYEVAENGVITNWSQITGNYLITSTGFVDMADNGLQLCIVDGNNEYIFALQTFTSTNPANEVTSTTAAGALLVNPAGNNFLGSATVTFVDGYFLFHQPNTNKWYLTQLYDGTQINLLDVAQTVGASSNIVRIYTINRQIFIFTEKSIEPWYDSGDNNFPWAPIPGIMINNGIDSAFGVCKGEKGLYFLSHNERGNGVLYMLNGYTPERVSTHAIEEMLREMGDLTSAYLYAYQEDGHEFIVVNVIGSNTTLVYDTTEKLWHERRWRDPLTGQYTRHRGQFHSFFWNRHIIGDWQTGQLYISSIDTYSDAGNPIIRERTAPHFFDDLNRVTIDKWQLDLQSGVGLDGNGQGSNPQLMFSCSKDGGHTYGKEMVMNAGAIGQFKTRAYVNMLGDARDWVMRVRQSDPVECVWIASKVEVRRSKN